MATEIHPVWQKFPGLVWSNRNADDGVRIRAALTRQDARLREVEVSVREDRSAQARLSFSIRAKLLLHPDSEPVAFDAVLHPGSQRYEVAPSSPRPA